MNNEQMKKEKKGKRKEKIAYNNSFLFSLFSFLLLIACNAGSVPEGSTYAVTVTGGTGGGNYEAGATVTITANTPPAGQQFANWTTASEGVSFADANRASTTFTMPANAVTVAAQFGPYAMGDTGPGGGIIFYYDPDGFTVKMEDPADNYTAHYLEAAPAITGTYQWGDNGTEMSGITTFTSLSAEDAATIGNGRKDTALIVAHLAEKGEANRAAQMCDALTSGGNNDWFLPGLGELNELYKQRNLADIDIIGVNYWSSSQYNNVSAWRQNFTDGSQSSSGKPSSFSIRAIRAFNSVGISTYAVTVTNGTGTGNYQQGATVTITADTPPDGQQFSHWSTASAGVSFVNVNSASTTFTMPENAVTVTANFVTIGTTTYAVTVTNGTGGGNYPQGATVTITANTLPDGQQFSHWSTESAGVTFADANSASTAFTMPENAVTVTANFVAIPTYAVTVENGTGSGNYPQGATVTITANNPQGRQQFSHWTTESVGVSFADANSADTTFTMPGNVVTVVANFEPLPPTYTIGDPGPGGGRIFYYDPEGFTVEGYGNPGDPGYFATYTAHYLEAAPASMPTGLKWQLAENNIPDTASAIGTGRKNTAVIHTYTDITPAASACVNYNNNGKTDWFLPSSGELNELCQQRTLPGINITSGSFWSSTQSNNANATLRTYAGSLGVGSKLGDHSVRAVRAFADDGVGITSYAVTVTNGTGTANYIAGATVTITADKALAGQQFKNWTTASAGVTFADTNRASTTFTMPANTVTVAANFEPIQTYAIGDTGPGGGIIFYYNANGFTVEAYGNPGDPGYFAAYTAHYLEVAPTITGTLIQWGSGGTSGLSTSFTTIGNGKKNTALIVAYLALTGETNRAAQICAELTSGGKNDWFLPSAGELNQLYQQRTLTGINITNGRYWSSTEGSYQNAWIMDFGNGDQGSIAKTDEYFVRAIRVF